MRDETAAVRSNSSTQQDADQPSLVEAVERVAQAGLEVVDKRVELIQLEVRAALSRSLTGGAFLIVALALLVIAWVGSMGAGFFVLRPRLGAPGALGAISALNFVLGAIAARVGWKSVSAGD